MLQYRFDGITLKPHSGCSDRDNVRQQCGCRRHHRWGGKGSEYDDDCGGDDNVQSDYDEPSDRTESQFERISRCSVLIRLISKELTPDLSQV